MSNLELTKEQTGLAPKSENPRRTELLTLFKENKDTVVSIYNAITNLADQSTLVEDSPESDQFKLVEHFNAFMGIITLNKFFRHAYINNIDMRHGFLTDGGLFKVKYNNITNEDIINEDITPYSMKQLKELSENDYKDLYDNIQKEIKENPKKWFFWPGCGMKIPTSFNIILDPNVVKTRLVATLKSDKSQQVIIDEKNYMVGFSILGDTHKLYKTNGERKLLPQGFFSIGTSTPERVNEFQLLNLSLENKGKYSCSIHIPFSSPKFDVRTTTTIVGPVGDDILIASTT